MAKEVHAEIIQESEIQTGEKKDIENHLVNLSDSGFNITEVETGLDEEQVNEFRRAQTSGLKIAREKHESEIVANWRLGNVIDKMMTIVESVNGSPYGSKAATHCARVFNLLPKQVTDYRRFAKIFSDQTRLRELLQFGPSWTIVRFLLQYPTEEARKEALTWLVHDNKFISSGDLKAIQDAKSASGERGDDESMADVTKKVMDNKKDKQKAKEEAKAAAVQEPVVTPATEATANESEPSDNIPSGPASSSKPSASSSGIKDADFISNKKLVKQIERLAEDLEDSLGILHTRISRIDDPGVEEKTVKSMTKAWDDVVIPKLSSLKATILAVETEAKGKFPKAV